MKAYIGSMVELDKVKEVLYAHFGDLPDNDAVLGVRRLVEALGSDGARLIAEERSRQVVEEGYDADHDAAHNFRSLARAGAAYALVDSSPITANAIWPLRWDPELFKPYDSKRNLARAGALIAAAIDRLEAE